MNKEELIILAIYINVDNVSKVYGEQMLNNLLSYYDREFNNIPDNKIIKTIWIPVKNQETRVDCVYPPSNIISKDGLIENELLKIYKLLSNYKNDEAKEIVRDIERKLKFKKIINKINEN